MRLSPMAFVINWPRVIRRSLRILAVLSGILLLTWLSLAWYINSHKEELLLKISRHVGNRVGGALEIGSLEPSVFRSFPDISISLNNVSLRDSLWYRHRRSLFEAKNVYVRLNPLAFFSQRVEVKKIVAAHGSIFLFTDSTGYSNSYLLERRDTTKRNRPAQADHFGLEDMHFWFVNETKQKVFHFMIKELEGTSTRLLGRMNYHVAASAHVYSMAFSTIRGSYLKNQPLDFEVDMSYGIRDKHLHIPDQKIRIGNYPVLFGADFYLNRTPPAFAVHLQGTNVPYKTALSWTSDNIQRVLSSYEFLKPVSLDISVSGVMKYRNIPLIKVTYPIRDNTLVTPLGKIEHLSYDGVYYNEAAARMGHGDNNSLVAMYRLKGQWRGIPFTADTLSVTNLLMPVVKAHIQSGFPIASLNNIIAGNIISFDKGFATADLRYNGAINPDDTMPHTINGYVRINDAALTYVPRNLVFTNAGATLLFQDDNLYFRNVTVRSRQSSLNMEGDALHFLRLYFTDPGKVNLSWRVRGPFVNLNDFLGFVAKRRKPQARYQPGRTNAISRINYQLNRVLEAASFSLDARINRMLYRSFVAEDVIARVTISQRGIVLRQAQVRHGGGSLSISGSIDQSAPNNPFQIKADVQRANVSSLFASFENFGQRAIGAENLAGFITSTTDVTGNVSDDGSILKNSFNGTVRFQLDDGQINHFAPFEKIGKFIFKKRNLSAVTVKELKGELEIKGPKILIHPMNIQTSVLNMDVQGVYGIGGGTDIYIQVPLRNPEREGAKTPFGMILRKGKGIVLHLRAQDPDGSGVKIGWDPLRHGKKATEEALEEQ